MSLQALSLVEAGSLMPLNLLRIDVDIRCEGFLSQTKVTMVWNNPSDRKLEAELSFPLPEGGAVCGYAVDIDNRLVPGVVVTKEKARATFEAEVRKDRGGPAIIEQSVGNIFNTRIHPFFPKGSRTIQVIFTYDLLSSQEGIKQTVNTYTLPFFISPGTPATQASLTVAIPRSFTPRISQGIRIVDEFGSIPQWRPSHNEQTGKLEWAFSGTSTDWSLRSPLEITLTGSEDASSLIVDRCGESIITMVGKTSDIPRSVSSSSSIGASWATSKIGLLWDVSTSRGQAHADRSKECDALDAVLNMFQGKMALDLFTFSVFPDEVPTAYQPNQIMDAVYKLRNSTNIPYFGGTNYTSLEKLVPNKALGNIASSYKFWIIVTDGISTFGSKALPNMGAPIYIMSAATQADHALLRRWVKQNNGGSYFNLNALSTSQVISGFTDTSMCYLYSTLGGITLTSEAVVKDSFASSINVVPASACTVEHQTMTISARLDLAHPSLASLVEKAKDAGSASDRIEWTAHFGQKANVANPVFSCTFFVDLSSLLCCPLPKQTCLSERAWARARLNEIQQALDALGKGADTKNERDAIEQEQVALSKAFTIVTPNTSLIVLETLQQYLDHMICPPIQLPEIYKQYQKRLAERLALEESKRFDKTSRVHSWWSRRKKWSDSMALIHQKPVVDPSTGTDDFTIQTRTHGTSFLDYKANHQVLHLFEYGSEEMNELPITSRDYYNSTWHFASTDVKAKWPGRTALEQRLRPDNVSSMAVSRIGLRKNADNPSTDPSWNSVLPQSTRINNFFHLLAHDTSSSAGHAKSEKGKDQKKGKKAKPEQEGQMDLFSLEAMETESLKQETDMEPMEHSWSDDDDSLGMNLNDIMPKRSRSPVSGTGAPSGEAFADALFEIDGPSIYESFYGAPAAASTITTTSTIALPSPKPPIKLGMLSKLSDKNKVERKPAPLPPPPPPATSSVYASAPTAPSAQRSLSSSFSEKAVAFADEEECEAMGMAPPEPAAISGESLDQLDFLASLTPSDGTLSLKMNEADDDTRSMARSRKDEGKAKAMKRKESKEPKEREVDRQPKGGKSFSAKREESFNGESLTTSPMEMKADLNEPTSRRNRSATSSRSQAAKPVTTPAPAPVPTPSKPAISSSGKSSRTVAGLPQMTPAAPAVVNAPIATPSMTRGLSQAAPQAYPMAPPSAAPSSRASQSFGLMGHFQQAMSTDYSHLAAPSQPMLAAAGQRPKSAVLYDSVDENVNEISNYRLESRNLQDIQRDVAEVKDVMMKNIDTVLNRAERLDDVISRSETLEQDSKFFYASASIAGGGGRSWGFGAKKKSSGPYKATIGWEEGGGQERFRVQAASMGQKNAFMRCDWGDLVAGIAMIVAALAVLGFLAWIMSLIFSWFPLSSTLFVLFLITGVCTLALGDEITEKVARNLNTRAAVALATFGQPLATSLALASFLSYLGSDGLLLPSIFFVLSTLAVIGTSVTIIYRKKHVRSSAKAAAILVVTLQAIGFVLTYYIIESYEFSPLIVLPITTVVSSIAGRIFIHLAQKGREQEDVYISFMLTLCTNLFLLLCYLVSRGSYLAASYLFRNVSAGAWAGLGCLSIPPLLLVTLGKSDPSSKTDIIGSPTDSFQETIYSMPIALQELPPAKVEPAPRAIIGAARLRESSSDYEVDITAIPAPSTPMMNQYDLIQFERPRVALVSMLEVAPKKRVLLRSNLVPRISGDDSSRHSLSSSTSRTSEYELIKNSSNLAASDQLARLFKAGSNVLDRRAPKDGLLVLSTLCEVHLEKPQLLRAVGYRLEEVELWEEAEYVFRRVLEMRGEEPQSYRDLALVLAKRKKYDECIDLFDKILTHSQPDWDSRFSQIEVVALMDLCGILPFMNQLELATGIKIPYSIVPAAASPVEAELRAVLTWDVDGLDLELQVLEPSGEVLNSFSNQSTRGGMLSRDFSGGYGPVEYLARRVASSGTYAFRAKVRTPTTKPILGGDATLRFTVFTDYGCRELQSSETVTYRFTPQRGLVIDLGFVDCREP